MRKILILMTLIIFSCTKKNEAYYLYSFTENAGLSIETYDDSYMQWGKVVAGTNLVFEYEYSAEDETNIQDDEYSEFIRFEINPDLTEFSYEDSQLAEINAVFSKSCFCHFENDPNKDVPPVGIISGKRISPTEWSISIDVIFYGDEHKNISSNFKLRN